MSQTVAPPATDRGAIHEHAPVLELSGIRAGYGPIEVLHGVDLVVPRGTVVALLGPNGAGKTTTLQVCAGFVAVNAGDLRMGGRSVRGVSPDALARLGVCTVPEGRGVFPNLSVRENLRMATYSGRSWQQIEDVAYARFPKLGERRNQLAGTMSGGEQQMLAMARALTTDPALLLIDELSMGLAPLIVAQLYESVAELARAGISILIVEQFARTVLGVADIAAVMLHGRITMVGHPDEVEHELSAAYLGHSQEEQP